MRRTPVFEDPQQPAEPPRPPSALRRAAVATALVGAVVAGGYGIASAQTDETPSTQDTPSTTAPGGTQQAPDGVRPDGRRCDHRQDGTSGAPSDSGSSNSSGSSAGANATSL
jgi:hypothetical protein